MQKLGHEHVANEGRLFMDSSNVSLKAVLLHNGNEKPSIPVGHVVGLKETYEAMELILKGIHYSVYKWNICGDLKVISLLLGLHLGYLKKIALCVYGTAAMTEIITLQKTGLKEMST